MKLREKGKGDSGSDASGAERPTSIADRMSLLEGAQKDWHKRIVQKDVKQFTVEGKLSMAGLCMFRFFAVTLPKAKCKFSSLSESNGLQSFLVAVKEELFATW